MPRPSRNRTKLAEIQQLCCLGLSSEISMPQLMPLMRDWLQADIGHFLWVDSSGAPINYCGDVAPDDAAVQTFFKNYQAMSMPGYRGYDDYVKTARSAFFGGKDDPFWHETTLYQEVMRQLSGECILGLVVRNGPENIHGSFTLQRASKNLAFTTEEQRRGEQIASFLRLLFDQEQAAPAPDKDFCVEQGMALFSTEGQLEHQDDSARKLILLAQHERIDAEVHASWRSGTIHQRLTEMCVKLAALFSGQPSSRPVFQVSNAWGRFAFRGHWLHASRTGERPLICVKVSHFIPMRLALWQRIAALDLPPRLQQICLEFVSGLSLTEIAEKTGLSRYTVIDHVNRLYERFGLLAGREGLVSFLLADNEQASH